MRLKGLSLKSCYYKLNCFVPLTVTVTLFLGRSGIKRSHPKVVFLFQLTSIQSITDLDFLRLGVNTDCQSSEKKDRKGTEA